MKENTKATRKRWLLKSVKQLLKAIALYPIGYSAYESELIDEAEFTDAEGKTGALKDEQRLKGKRFKDEILKATAGNEEYEETR